MLSWCWSDRHQTVHVVQRQTSRWWRRLCTSDISAAGIRWCRTWYAPCPPRSMSCFPALRPSARNLFRHRCLPASPVTCLRRWLLTVRVVIHFWGFILAPKSVLIQKSHLASVGLFLFQKKIMCSFHTILFNFFQSMVDQAIYRPWCISCQS